MRPARLVVLAGLLVAAGGLYLRYLRVDGEAFAGLAGREAPTIWAEFGTPERIAAVAAVAVLVALAFRPHTGSWDLWGGFPANLGAIQILKEYMSSEIGIEDGELIAVSKGLHLYDYSWDLAKAVLRMK